MDRLQQLTDYFNRVASDNRLKPVHISLFMALCHAWITSNFQCPYHISRRRLMSASRIRSKATYHKVIRELQFFGYLKYQPSYHPVKGSAIELSIYQHQVLNWLQLIEMNWKECVPQQQKITFTCIRYETLSDIKTIWYYHGYGFTW